MTPLLELRNELDKPDDRDRRDFRRMNGRVQLFHDRTIPGPYTKEWREHWLRRVLEAQHGIRQEGPPEFRRSSSSPSTNCTRSAASGCTRSTSSTTACRASTRKSTGETFPRRGTNANGLRADDWETLREVCGDDQAFFDLQVALLGVERQFRGMSRRAGIYEALEEQLRTGPLRQRAGGRGRAVGAAASAGGRGAEGPASDCRSLKRPEGARMILEQLSCGTSACSEASRPST